MQSVAVRKSLEKPMFVEALLPEPMELLTRRLHLVPLALVLMGVQ